MTVQNEINFGPLYGLIGTWEGSNGEDISPEPDQTENNPYFETIEFSSVDDEIENAESQSLVAVTYLQKVYRKSTGKLFHHQTGYWIWNSDNNELIHTFTIPRGVGVMAAGSINENGEFQVNADIKQPYWNILQSPFMTKNAKTLSFTQKLKVTDNQLTYSQTTLLDIYGRQFEHTDTNTLHKK